MADVSSPALYPHLPLHGLVGRAIPRTSLKPRRQRPPLAMSRPYRPRSTPRFFEASSAVIPNGPPHSCFVPIIVVISSRTFWPHPPLCVLDGGFTCIVLRNSAFLSSERNVRVIALSRLQVEVVVSHRAESVTGGSCVGKCSNKSYRWNLCGLAVLGCWVQILGSSYPNPAFGWGFRPLPNREKQPTGCSGALSG